MVKLNDTGLFVAKQDGVNYAVSAELLKEYTSPLAKQELGDPYYPGIPGMVMPGDGFTYDESTGLLEVNIPPGIQFIGLIGNDGANGEVLAPDPYVTNPGSFYIVAEDDEFFGVDESDWPGLDGDAYGQVHLNLNDKVVLNNDLEWVIIPTISSDAYLGRYGDRVSNAPGDVIYQFGQSLSFESVPSDINLKAGGDINLDSTSLNGNFTDDVILDIDGDVFVNHNGNELKFISSGLIQTLSQNVVLDSAYGLLIGDDWNVEQEPVEQTHIANKKYVDDQLYVDPDDCGEYTQNSNTPGLNEIKIYDFYGATRIEGVDQKFENGDGLDVKVTYSNGNEYTLTSNGISGDSGTYFHQYNELIPSPLDGELVTFCLIDANREKIYVTYEEFEEDQRKQNAANLAADALIEVEILALNQKFDNEQLRQDDEIEAIKDDLYLSCDTPELTSTLSSNSNDPLSWHSVSNSGNLEHRIQVNSVLHQDEWPSPLSDVPDHIYVNNVEYEVLSSGVVSGSDYYYELAEFSLDNLVDQEVTVSLCGGYSFVTHEEFEADQDRQDQKITNLEEEINALAPVIDDGTWIYNGTVTNVNTNPGPGKFYLQFKDPNTSISNIVTSYSQANEIIVHNTDAEGKNYTWADVKAGQYVQLFDKNDPGTIVGSIITPPKDKDLGGFVVMHIDRLQHQPPNPVNDEEVKLKIFEPPSGGDASQFILRTGDTMEGDLTFEDPNDASKAVNIVMKNEGELRTTKINSSTLGYLKIYERNNLKLSFQSDAIVNHTDAKYNSAFTKTIAEDSQFIPDTKWVKKVIDFTQYNELTP